MLKCLVEWESGLEYLYYAWNIQMELNVLENLDINHRI